MSSTNPALDSPFQRLREVRLAILHLHKALLDSERIVYEQFHGRIQSNGEFLRLVLEHDWFSWLRPISQFIVQIDEALSAKEPATLSQVNDLLEAARNLLKPAEDGTTLEKRYYRAIQRNPDIAIMHAQISQLLSTDRA